MTISKFASLCALYVVLPLVSSAQNAYVDNDTSSGPTIAVIDTATNTLLTSIAMSDGSQGIAVSPDGTRVYAAHQNANTVSVIDTATNSVVATVSVGTLPFGIAVLPNGSAVYVSNFHDATISVINTATNTVTATISSSNTGMLAASPDSSKVYSTNNTFIDVISTATNAVTATISGAPNALGQIAVTPDGTTAYAVDNLGVAVFNLQTNSYTTHIAPSNAPFCYGVAASPDGSKVYAGCGSASKEASLQVISTAGNSLIGSIDLGVMSEPENLALSHDGTAVYVQVPFNNYVKVVNLASNSVVATVTLHSLSGTTGIFIQPPASVPGQSGKQVRQCNCNCSGLITGTGSVCVGEPIDVASGNMAYHDTDYTTAGQNPLSFTRYYNSRGITGGLTTFAVSLGINWRSNYDRYLQLSATRVIAERADGQQLTFILSGSTWVTDTDVDVTLTKAGSTWTLKDLDDTTETYTAITTTEALLNTIQLRNGYTQTLNYNGSNQLTSVTDSYSRSLVLNYNGNGTLNTVTTPDSTTITNGYTAGGSGLNLTSVTYPTAPASVVTYVYEDSGMPNVLTGIVDENSNRYATWSYDPYSRGLISQLGTGTTAQIVSVSYDDTTGNRTVTNPLGVQDTYSFTTLQGVPKVTGISRAATSTTAAATRAFTYDTNGYLATATDWNGNSTTYTNNTHGQPTKIVEPTRTTNISYDPTFVHLPHQITTTGLKSVFAYDTSGNPHTRTDTDTTTQTIPYSTNGQTRIWTYNYTNFLLTSVQNPRTDLTIVTQYGYGPDGALTSITDPLTHVTSITSHTGGGRPLTIVDPNSVTTTLTYDQRQRLTTSAVTTSTGVLTTTYTIDPTGELKELILPDSSSLTYTYDTAHRVTQVTDTQNNYTQYTPDALGDITAVNTFNNSGGLRYQHSATFDALGRILTDVGGAGQTTTYSNYDNNGNVQTITDPLTNPATQVFDVLNRLTQITDANTGITKFTYDTHNRTTKVTDANVHATSYVYDGFGDAIQQTSPDSGVTVYHYDGDANVTQKVDALAATVNMTYDKLDRVATRSYPADSSQFVGYVYDQSGGTFGFGVGQLTTMTDPMGTHNLQYDERGNIVAHRRFTNPGGVSLGHIFFAYDAASRLSNVTYPSGMTLYYNRDSIGNIYKVTLTAPGSSTQQTVAFAAYKPFGPLYSLTFGNNESESLQFDNDYRMLEVTDTNTSSVNLMDQVYGYDAANNLKTVTDNVNTANNQTLGYDVLNRLHTGVGNYGSYTWTLDKVGNLKTLKIGTVTTTYTYTTATNQIATLKVGSNPAVTVTTNANGNITGIPPANNSTAATFSYDVTNRLSSVSGTSPAITAIVYDAFGERYSKQDSGSSATTYAYDFSGNLLEETISGAVTDYIYLNGMPLSVFVPGGTLGTVYYVHTDRQGTPQLVTNASQTAVWSTTYQPYGTTPTIVSSIVQNLRFPGQHFDLETGFHYNNARDYMPNLGRYLEADPIGLSGGLNPYRYANANPGRFVDRRGRDVAGAVIGGIYGAVSAAYGASNMPGATGSDIAIATVLGGLTGTVVGAIVPPTSLLASAVAGGLAGELSDLVGQEEAILMHGGTFNLPENVGAGLGGLIAGASGPLFLEMCPSPYLTNWAKTSISQFPSLAPAALGGLVGAQYGPPPPPDPTPGVVSDVHVSEAIRVPLSH
jgi:RHS repeat-associated protein